MTGLAIIDPKGSNSKRGLRHKQLFLTYPKCPIFPREVLEQLTEIFKSRDTTLKRYVIAQELHIDGEPHLHCFVLLDKQFYDATIKKLDLIQFDQTCHGNYQAVRSKAATIEYCLKSPRFIASSDVMMDFKKGKYPDAVYAQCLELAKQGKVDAAVQIYTECMPAKVVLRGLKNTEQQLKKVAKLYQIPAGLSKFEPDQFISHAPLNKALADDKKVTWVHGPPGTIKTQYVMTILEKVLKINVLFVDNPNGLAAFDPKIHQVIVFDDIPMGNLKREQLISLIDKEMPRTAKILYSVVTLPEFTGRVIICNFHPSKLWDK